MIFFIVLYVAAIFFPSIIATAPQLPQTQQMYEYQYPLHGAVQAQYEFKGMDAIDYLVFFSKQPNMDINAYDNHGYTPLHYCILNPFFVQTPSAHDQESNRSIIRLRVVLSHPMLDVNKKSRDGRTALHMLMQSRLWNKEKASLLLYHPDINLFDGICSAIKFNNEEAVMTLLDHPSSLPVLDEVAQEIFCNQHGRDLYEGGVAAIWFFVEKNLGLLEYLALNFHHKALYKEYLSMCQNCAWRCREVESDGRINLRSLELEQDKADEALVSSFLHQAPITESSL